LLYKAWKGIEGDEDIWFTTYDGSNWALQQNVSGVGSSVGPALVQAFPLPAEGASARETSVLAEEHQGLLDTTSVDFLDAVSLNSAPSAGCTRRELLSAG
jgi:hypothetical protein